jgi:hypothetical protein
MCGWLMPLVSDVWLANKCRWYLMCGWLMPLVSDVWLADAAGI